MTKREGRYGVHGGQYVPETLMNAVLEVEKAYEKYKNDPDFNKELDDLNRNYTGRPSLLYYAKKMSEDLGGTSLARHSLPREWARQESLPRPAQASTA